jgi:glycosyltransferase 2 family protein
VTPAARAARLLVAAGLFAALLYYANPAEVGRTLAGADWRWVGAAAALVLIDRTLMAWRWIALLAPIQHGTRPPVAALLRIFFVTTFIGTFLPSVGGDAVRAWRLARAGVASHESFASVLMDRLLGVIAILIAAAAGLAVAPDLLGHRAVWIGLALAVAGCAAGMAVVYSTRAGRALLDLVTRVVGSGRIHRGVDQLFAALRAYRGRHGLLTAVLAGSLAVQIIRILQAWLLGLALGIAAGPAAYFAFIPIILLVLLLPFPGNGIGSSQAAFMWTFGLIGVAADQAFALSVLFIGLGIVGNVPGAFIYAFGGSGGAREVRA